MFGGAELHETDATLDDLREAVEDARGDGQIARRVLGSLAPVMGGSHP